MKKDKIPTAEAFYNSKADLPRHIDEFTENDICNLMIEFAKLHVKAALASAAKKVLLDVAVGSGGFKTKTLNIDCEQDSEFYWIKVDKDSILNSYPLEKIKYMSKYKNIMEIHPKSVENAKGFCICDKCKNTFEPKDTLVEMCNNIEFQSLMGIKGNIEFQGLMGIKGITKGKNTWYLVSPCCKETHLFGFDVKNKL